MAGFGDRRLSGIMSPNDFQLCGLLKRCEVEAGLGEEALEQARPVLHPPEPCPDQRGVGWPGGLRCAMVRSRVSAGLGGVGDGQGLCVVHDR